MLFLPAILSRSGRLSQALADLPHGEHRREDEKREAHIHYRYHSIRPERERGGIRPDEDRADHRRRAAQPYDPAPAGHVSELFAPVARRLAPAQTQTELREINEQRHHQKIREHPQRHHQRLDTLHRLEKHHVPHQREKRPRQLRRKLRTERAEELENDRREHEAGKDHPNHEGPEAPRPPASVALDEADDVQHRRDDVHTGDDSQHHRHGVCRGEREKVRGVHRAERRDKHQQHYPQHHRQHHLCDPRHRARRAERRDKRRRAENDGEKFGRAV